MSNIAVYEIKDGESTYGFIKTVFASVTPVASGISTRVQKVTLRLVLQRYADYKNDLPCNYTTLDNATLQGMLDSTDYGHMYVSLLGKNIINKINEG